MSLVRLAEPYNVGELVMLQSLLEGSGIAYLIRHANVSSLYPGRAGIEFSCHGGGTGLPASRGDFAALRLDVREVTGDIGG